MSEFPTLATHATFFCGYALLMYTVVRLYVCQAPQNFFLTLTRLENGCDKFCIFLLQFCCLHSLKMHAERVSIVTLIDGMGIIM